MSWEHSTQTMTWSVPVRHWPGDGPLVVGFHGMGQSDRSMARRLAVLASRAVFTAWPVAEGVPDQSSMRAGKPQPPGYQAHAVHDTSRWAA